MFKNRLSDNEKILTIEGYLTDNQTGKPLSNQTLCLRYNQPGCDDDVRTYSHVITDQNGYYYGEIYYGSGGVNPTYLEYYVHGNYGSIYIQLSTYYGLLVTEGVFYSK